MFQSRQTCVPREACSSLTPRRCGRSARAPQAVHRQARTQRRRRTPVATAVRASHRCAACAREAGWQTAAGFRHRSGTVRAAHFERSMKLVGFRVVDMPDKQLS
eukprot:818591-Pleurochrysis_carterae.AAC.3